MKTSITKIKKITRQRFGGYIVYWSLFFQLLRTTYRSNILTKFQKFETFYELIVIKSIWYLLIKPLGCLFRRTDVYKGTIQKNKEYNYEETKFNIVKTSLYKIFWIIPFWYYRTKTLSEQDYKNLGY